MKAIDAFDFTINRAKVLLEAHERLRGEGPGKRPRFHAETLRAIVVTAVSAMDAYFHDKILENLRPVIRRTSPAFPQKLTQFLSEGMKADKSVSEFLEICTKSRPLAHIRTMVDSKLSERAFQDPGKIEWGMQLVGVDQFWQKVSDSLNTESDALKRNLQGYVRRRHAIVHRGDLGTSKKHKHKVRKIKRLYAENCVDEIESFIKAAEDVIKLPAKRTKKRRKKRSRRTT